MKTILFLSLMLSSSVFATECFKINAPNHSDIISNSAESWCKHTFEKFNTAYELIFQYDLKKGPQAVKPHLSFLNHSASGRVAYGFLNRGELKLAVSHIEDFNPIPPHVWQVMSDSRGLSNVVTGPTLMHVKNLSSLKRIKKIFAAKLSLKSNLHPTSTISSGRFEAYLDKSSHPFSGYWWPSRKMQMAKGKSAPMPLYDSAVQNFLSLPNPGATKWELQHHDSQIRWGGHCNGWAAASILAKEPQHFLKIPGTDEVVSPAVQKAWLTESHYCVNLSFYGKRYRRDGDNKKDLNPASFHKLLVQYIQNQKKAVVLDIKPLKDVDNQVVTGFSMRIRKGRNDQFRVRTRLQMHGYSRRASNTLGSARIYSKTYRYTLYTDGNGRITGGKWDSSSNPDFLWVPLAQANCGNENPKVDASLVDKLIRTLPHR